MDASPRLNLPYVLRAQAQANVTHNEASLVLPTYIPWLSLLVTSI